MNEELPQRKHPRLSSWDYSRAGSYFITLCAENRRHLFSSVGRGLAPAEENNTEIYIELSQFGKILEEELKNITKRYPYAVIDKYVIMPDHLHFIITLSAGASPRPTVMDIICAYKSIATRRCKQIGYMEKRLFQTSFFEHIIRNQDDYNEILKYIRQNPANWYRDSLYSEKNPIAEI